MKTFLFLDDWLLDGYRDVTREWNVAKPAPGVEPYTPINGHMSVWYDPERRKYGCLYFSYEGSVPEKNEEMWKEPDIFRITYLAESDDGYHFRPWDHGGPTDMNVPDRKHSLYFPLRKGATSKLKTEAILGCTRDAFAKNPDERFIAPLSTGEICTSPDAIRWTTHADRKWADKAHDSDDLNDLIFNPIAQKYMVVCRTGNLDRRVAITESDDMRTFTPRHVVLQPDVLDPPLLQFYGMTPFWYEDMFVGILWDYRVPQEEEVYSLNNERVVKMRGTMDNSFCYSYDGRHWMRGPRTRFLPRAELGEYGAHGHYGSGLVVGPDNVMRIYSQAIRVEHGDIENQKKFWGSGSGDSAMRVYNLRKDGFACLASLGTGSVRTRGLIPKDGDLRINFQAPLGWVKVQLSKSNGEPHEGFSFEDSIAMTGDDVEARPQWKSGKKLEELAGKWLRIEFRMFQAKLYAYRWDCTLHFALRPQERM